MQKHFKILGGFSGNSQLLSEPVYIYTLTWKVHTCWLNICIDYKLKVFDLFSYDIVKLYKTLLPIFLV